MLEGGKSALRLTFATYWRPSGLDIHKQRDAKDTDNWGVRPDEGLEVIIGKEAQEKLYQQRQDRDINVIDDGQEATGPRETKPSQSPPAPEPDSDAASETPAVDTSTPEEDLQLQRAIEYLEKQLRPKQAISSTTRLLPSHGLSG
jgi:carboxyl-terminal processing protease